MPSLKTLFLLLGLAVLTAGALAAAPGSLQEAAAALASKKAQERTDALSYIAENGDSTLVPLLEAYRNGLLESRDGTLAIYESRVEVPGQGEVYPLVDAFTGEALRNDAGEPIYSKSLGRNMIKAARQERGEVTAAVSRLQLNNPDPTTRRRVVLDAGDRGDSALIPILSSMLEDEKVSKVKAALRESIARLELVSGTREQKMAAAEYLRDERVVRSLQNLQDQQKIAAEAGDAELAAALQRSVAALESYIETTRTFQNLFSGVSLGSILIFMALGLSIIFGLMGVINMAHGEFLMIGAYTAYIVSEIFKAYMPAAAFDYYMIAALPAAFIMAGAIGLLVERVIIRHLYGRPLETLLATWGVSLILIQTARVIFGDLRSVTPPSWLSGGWEVAPNLILPLNRLFIIIFCTVCIAGTYLMINKTRLGLLLRATTQNREMAESLGVSSRRIDGFTFAFGTGLAGLAGSVVPMFDKLNPNVGQGYIVDAFLTVVLGGVGKLAGTIAAGTGLGITAKTIEPWTGAVWGKVAILGLVILVLQWKPAGLFAPKGRQAAEA